MTKRRVPHGVVGAGKDAPPTTTIPCEPLEEYWLHVKDDGTEVRYNRDPWRPECLRVVLIRLKRGRLVEQTKTVTIRVRSTFGKIISVRPRGKGWRL
jgi:hypothetical protein